MKGISDRASAASPRIFVTGPTGSGKSTLAAKLARRASVPLHALDDIHWVRDPAGDRRREPGDRLAHLERLVREDAWVIEGVQFKWADAALERATRIIVLDPPRWRNILRILRRFITRRRAPAPNPRGTLRALREELQWSADYYGHERRMLFAKLARWSGKVVTVRARRSDHALVQELVGKQAGGLGRRSCSTTG